MATGSSFPSRTAAAAAPQSAVPAAPANPEFLTTDEAGAFLRLSPRTLEKQRVLGGGPRFRKFGARVVYAATDLRAWADTSGGFRKLIQIVFGLSIAFAASSFFLTFFSFTGGAVLA